MSGGIFVSYRREDTKHAAGRLVERLGRTFSSDQIFLDIDNIAPGLDFKKVLSQKVQLCDVLLAIIGPDWLDVSDDKGRRRLYNPKDFVRIEIEAALARDIRVIPVPVDGAPMPDEEALPDTLRPLADRNAVRLMHESFGADAGDLVRALTTIVTPAAGSATAFTDYAASDWQAHFVARGDTGFVITLAKGGKVHLVELDLKSWRLRDRILIDGKEEFFTVLSYDFTRKFQLEGHPDSFELRVTLRGILTYTIKSIELMSNGSSILSA